MAEYSLTLSSLKFANVPNFVRSFGTKKTALQNAGSLTTEECNVANALPFDLQRPLVVTETSTVSNIQYDAKILINAASVTLTLASTGVTEGITVTLMAAYQANITFNTTSASTTITDVLQAGEQAKLIFIGGRWEIVQDCGDVTSRAGTLKPFGTIICDGSIPLLQAKYPRLFAELGTRYNLSTDSSDVFRTPDMRNRTIMGANPDVTGKADGNTSNVGDVQKASAPNITGLIPHNASPKGNVSGAIKDEGALGGNGVDNSSGGWTMKQFSFNASNTNASTDHLGDNVYANTDQELRSANIRMNYVIKY